MNARELTLRGYRRVSNRHRMVSRIDRPDWVEVLAKKLHRSPAELYLPDGRISPSWCDFYRRVHSKDTLVVSQEVYRQIPSSGWDGVGYVPARRPRKPRLVKVCGIWVCGRSDRIGLNGYGSDPDEAYRAWRSMSHVGDAYVPKPPQTRMNA